MHSEQLASVAKEANERGRFWIQFTAADPSAPEWNRYVARGTESSVVEERTTPFDPAFRVVLAAMSACRVARLTPKLIREQPGAPLEWLARFATGARGVFDVNVGAGGVCDDLDAWWWLVSHGQVMITCDVARLDTTALFSVASRLIFATARFALSPATLSYAKEVASNEGSLVLVPRPRGFLGASDWCVLLVATPGLAGQLAQEVVRRVQMSLDQQQAHEAIDVAILETTQAANYWADSISAKDVEKYMLSALRRSVKYPELEIAAIRGLAAAEGVAIAEGRGLAPRGLMAQHTTSVVTKRLKKSDPLAESTIEVAIQAVLVIAEAGVTERKRWASEEGRAAFRAELDGLRKRLVAALAARRVRSRASNAVPLTPLRQAHTRPTNWSTRRLHLLFDDVVALLGVLREQTGAVPMVLLRGKALAESETGAPATLRELQTEWDVHEFLANLDGEPLDQRTGSFPKLWSALRVLLWWPDVSPRPEVCKEDAGWDVASWGHAELRLAGATSSKVLQSSWLYPTGTETKQAKFAGAGPWRDVDWTALRRQTKAVSALIKGPLGGVPPVGVRNTWILPAAAASARAGERLLLGDGSVRLSLPD